MPAAVRAFTVDMCISATREEIFELVADLSRRIAWTDHYMRDYRLARAKPAGRGAAARFRMHAPFARQWVEFELAEVEVPRRVVERGRLGRLGRSEWHAVYDLRVDGPAHTRVVVTAWTEPGTRFDALREALGARRWLRRQVRVSLRRLRLILEEPPAEPLARVTIAGYEPLKSPRFGA